MKLFKKKDETRQQRRIMKKMAKHLRKMYDGSNLNNTIENILTSHTVVGNSETTTTSSCKPYLWTPYNETTTYSAAQIALNSTYGTSNYDYYHMMNNPFKLNNNTLKTTDMNDSICNQKQEESAIKYLTQQRTEASPVMELDIKDYNKLKEENAQLKANVDLIRYEETFDGEDAVISYSGKDKVITGLVNAKQENEQRIRDLEKDLKITNENWDETQTTHQREMDRIHKDASEKVEDQVEAQVKQIKKNHRNEVKDLENAIDDLNDKIREANDRNSILSDLNKRYQNSLRAILDMISSKGKKWFKNTFGLKAILLATNQYRVSSPNCGRDMYLNEPTGHFYYA